VKRTRLAFANPRMTRSASAESIYPRLGQFVLFSKVVNPEVGAGAVGDVRGLACIPRHRSPTAEVAQALRRPTEDDVPHLGTATLQSITWSTVSGSKGLENDVILVAGLTDIESDWHRGVTYVGMSRARTRLHVIIHEDCDKKRRAREEEWRERVDSDVEMLL